jgi:hypothetical protein
MLSIPITLEQLIFAVKQLQPSGRAQVAEVLLQVGLRSDLTALIQEFYGQAPDDEITDDEIMEEIKIVRQRSRDSGFVGAMTACAEGSARYRKTLSQLAQQ